MDLRKLLCVLPFDEHSATFTSRFLPLRDALLELDVAMDMMFTGPGACPNFLKHDQAVPSESVVGHPSKISGHLPPEISTGVSELGYFWLGRLVPPFFRFRDLVVAIRSTFESFDAYDGVVCSKPWLRTVVPSLRLSAERGIPAVLDIDDFDITPSAAILDRFDGVSVATKVLAQTFKRQHPLLIPNAPVKSLLLPRERVCDVNQKTRFIWICPGTGVSDSVLLRTIQAILAGIGSCKLTLVGFPRRITEGVAGLNQPSVAVHDRLPHSSLVNLLDQHDVSLVLESKTRYEMAKGSIRLVESMARGLSIIAWNIGETAFVVSDSGGGLLVPYGDYAKLTSAMALLSQDQSLVTDLGSRSWSYASRMQTWPENARALMGRFSL